MLGLKYIRSLFSTSEVGMQYLFISTIQNTQKEQGKPSKFFSFHLIHYKKNHYLLIVKTDIAYRIVYHMSVLIAIITYG